MGTHTDGGSGPLCYVHPVQNIGGVCCSSVGFLSGPIGERERESLPWLSRSVLCPFASPMFTGYIQMTWHICSHFVSDSVISLAIWDHHCLHLWQAGSVAVLTGTPNSTSVWRPPWFFSPVFCSFQRTSLKLLCLNLFIYSVSFWALSQMEMFAEFSVCLTFLYVK